MGTSGILCGLQNISDGLSVRCAHILAQAQLGSGDLPATGTNHKFKKAPGLAITILNKIQACYTLKSCEQSPDFWLRHNCTVDGMGWVGVAWGVEVEGTWIGMGGVDA